jgi:hypothetical protein
VNRGPGESHIRRRELAPNVGGPDSIIFPLAASKKSAFD